MATSDDHDDERAVLEAARSNPARFLELYERHFHRVYAYVLRRTRNRTEAEDVTAEVFRRALANLARYEWRGVPFAAWLFRIAAHELADRREESERQRDAHPPKTAVEPDLERQVALWQLVDQLPRDQRRVIELRFGEGRSIQEAAQALGKSEGAIKQLQRRAMERLREDLVNTNG